MVGKWYQKKEGRKSLRVSASSVQLQLTLWLHVK